MTLPLRCLIAITRYSQVLLPREQVQRDENEGMSTACNKPSIDKRELIN